MKGRKTTQPKNPAQIDFGTNINKHLVARKKAEGLRTERMLNEKERQRLKQIWQGL